MYKTVILVIALVTALTTQAQSLIFKVNIKHHKEKIVRLHVGEVAYSMELDDDGSALTKISIDEPQFATFAYGKFVKLDIYLTPGIDLELSNDLTASGALKITCDDGGINQYLVDYLNAEGLSRSDWDKDLKGFLETVDEVIANQQNNLMNKELPIEFKTIQKENITYNINRSLLYYPTYQAKAQNNPNYEPSPAYFIRLKSLLVDKPELMHLTAYNSFITETIQALGVKNSKSQLEFCTKMARLASGFKTTSFKEPIIYDAVYNYINLHGIDGAEELLHLFIENVKDDKKIQVIDELVGKYSKVMKGQDSPKFNYVDIAGDHVSLDDLKGKYVYIDLWASWCGPCKQEIPHLKSLKKKFRKKNIHFVGISTDKDIDAWKKELKKQKLDGIQLNSGGDEQFMKEYNVNGIPRFILIDKKGKIVMANAPRPSSEEIYDLLNGLEGF
ncbi:MAG: TlpA family protein disulfide reductase [Carboxylicivirga sp.]|jgi:thiol-disulfide isomerase/thioredoxin|nr:TlpA family protein disulfide reductase [Carboxylicivirga sp.]